MTTRMYLMTTAFLFCVFSQWSVAARSKPESEMQGKVVGVSDGDTVTVLSSNETFKIRLAGIDAPEKKQAFGTRAKQKLSELVFGKMVTVKFKSKDRYGRVVGRIVADEKDINLLMVQSGMAWVYRQYERALSSENRTLYEGAETEAKQKKLGLWQDSAPTPPWDFRRKKRSALQPESSPQMKHEQGFWQLQPHCSDLILSA